MSDTNAKRILDGNQSRPSMQVLDAAQAEDGFMLLKGRDGALLVRILASDLGVMPVEFPEAQEIKNADGAPIATLLQYTYGASREEWKPRSGTATITVAIDASNSDVQNGYGMELLRFLMPADPVGTAFKLQFCTTVDGTFEDMLDDADLPCSFPVSATNKGKWVNLHIKAPFGRGMFYFRFVSNDTETANQSIEYVLG